MNEEITKETLQKLMRIKGEARGLASKDDMEYILATRGREALEKLEKTLKELGYPLKFKDIKTMGFYPVGQEGVVLLALKKTFGFTEKDFAEMGRVESKQSLIIRLFMKYFLSVDRVFKEASNMWRKYYTAGELKPLGLNKKENSVFIRVENFSLHPFHCYVLKGYFSGVTEMITGASVTCEERKCVFRGDDCHEYFIKWEQRTTKQ